MRQSGHFKGGADSTEAVRMPWATHLQRFDAVGRGGQLVCKTLRLALQLLPLLLAELGRRAAAAAAGKGAAAAAPAGDAGQGEDGQQQDRKGGAARLSCTRGWLWS